MTRPIILDIIALDNASRTFTKVGLAAQGMAAEVKDSSATMGGAFMTVGIALGAFAFDALKTSADFEAIMTRLVTTAGESTKNLGLVSKGIDDIAGKTGFGVTKLADAMYYVESGGFHGAAGLKVLGDAAKGAAIEGSNVTDVAHALAGVLNDYRGTTLTSAEATNAMTAAVGSGMMKFQDLAVALPNIGARAAATGISFEEMLAALGTMTRDGLPAAKAATFLGQTIGHLAAPTGVARTELMGLGINATKLSATLISGSGHGLGDAIRMVYEGVQKHLVGAGIISVDTFKKMQNSTTGYQQVLAKLPPALQTGVQALATISGGVRSFQGLLMLGGKHAAQYAQNLHAVNHQVHLGSTEIAGYSRQQATLSGQMKDAYGAFTALAKEFGDKLRPYARDAFGEIHKGLEYMRAHLGTVTTIAGVVGAMAATFLVLKSAQRAVAITTAALGGADLLLAVGQTIAGVATWNLTAAMTALDAAMAINPFALILDVIILVVAGFVLMYEKVGWFRTGANAAFKGIGIALVFLWNDVIKPVFKAIWDIVRFVTLVYAGLWEAIGLGIAWVAQKLGINGHVIRTVLKAIALFFTEMWEQGIKPVLSIIVKAFLGFVGILVNGAAKALGWLSGIGKQLTQGANAFNAFANSVNNSLQGIQNKTITITTVTSHVDSAAPTQSFIDHAHAVKSKSLIAATPAPKPAPIPNYGGIGGGIPIGGGGGGGKSPAQKAATAHQKAVEQNFKDTISKFDTYISSKSQTLNGLISARASIVGGIQGKTADVFNQDFTQGGTTPVSVQSVLAFQQSELTKATQLQADIAKVTSMGLSKALVQQFAASGTTGVDTLHALALGPASAITSLNALNAQTSSALSSAGAMAGNTVYGAQIQAAQRDKAMAVTIRNELDKLLKQHDKKTIVELHIDGKILRFSLLQLKRNLGGKALGLA